MVATVHTIGAVYSILTAVKVSGNRNKSIPVTLFNAMCSETNVFLILNRIKK